MLDRERIVRLLLELSDELAAAGVQGRLFVVGGAAMALAFGRERVTRDVDGLFEPASVVRDAAGRVGRRHGLGDDWLIDAIKGYLLGANPDATIHLQTDSLVVQVASPRYLFMMKALAARVDQDATDLLRLYEAAGFTSVEEALAHVEASAPAHLLSPKAAIFVRELLEEDR